MRYAIFSDIHSNIEAFESVLDAYSKESIDAYLCVGDIVGYAANPKECIDLFKELSCVSVLGNHDAAVAGRIDTLNFTPIAAEAVFWTKEHVEKDCLEFLNSLQYIYENECLTLAHGTLFKPELFMYLLNKTAAFETFGIMDNRVCFVGHSHAPLIIVQDQGGMSYLDYEKAHIQKDKKYIVNVGSVGQPRDRDPRASYCIYDTELGIIQIKRVDYDISATQRKIIQAGLPSRLASRLSQGS